MPLGGLFCEIYSFERFLYDFWILVILGGPFWGLFWVFGNLQNRFHMRMCDFVGLFSEIYSFERSLYYMCLTCLDFSLTECNTFIVTGWLGESLTIVNRIVTRSHYLLVRNVYQSKLKCQLHMYVVLAHSALPHGVTLI